MKIETLITDIYSVLDDPNQSAVKLDAETIGKEFIDLMQDRMGEQEEERDPSRGLRASSIGVPCERQLWYRINKPDLGEPFEPFTKFKFLYGHVTELLALELVRMSGHLVEGEQTELELGGVLGHRDCVIDGMTVDVKSASSFAFDKFKNGNLNPTTDSFGYLTQLKFYLAAARKAGDPTVKERNRAAFLAVDKTNGHLCLDVHEFSDEELDEMEALVEHKKVIVGSPELPDRGFEDEPDGKSGNRKLGVNCSYCAFKFACWPDLKAFAYSGRPRFLTKVAREPNVKPF